MAKAIRENLQFLILLGTLVAGSIMGLVKLVYGTSADVKKELRAEMAEKEAAGEKKIDGVEARVNSRFDKVDRDLESIKSFLMRRGREREPR